MHGLDLRVARDLREHFVRVHAVRRVLPPEIEPVAALKDLDPGGRFDGFEQCRKQVETVEVIVLEMGHPIHADPVEIGNEDPQGRIVFEPELESA